MISTFKPGLPVSEYSAYTAGGRNLNITPERSGWLYSTGACPFPYMHDSATASHAKQPDMPRLNVLFMTNILD